MTMLLPQQGPAWTQHYHPGHWLPGVGAACQWLQERQLKQLVVIVPPSATAHILLQAAWLKGVHLILINHRLPLHRQEHLLHSLALESPALLGQDDHPLADFFLPPSWDEQVLIAKHIPHDEHARAWTMFSSGTTGSPQVIHLQRNEIIAAAIDSSKAIGLNQRTPWLSSLGIDHVGGAMTSMRSLATGNPLCLQPFDPALTWDALATCWGASLVPTMLFKLLQHRSEPWPPSLQCLLIGGAHLDQHLAKQCQARGLAPRRTYGLSEACSMVTCQTYPSLHPHNGPVIGAWEIDIRPLPHLTAGGAIWIRHPVIGLGHWIQTGDIGDLDSSGNLIILDRRNDLIVCGGENLSPKRIEDTLCSHPNITQAMVVGISDDLWGKKPAALLVGDPIPDVDFHQWMQQHLTGLERLHIWQWVDAVPLNLRGKPDRQQARTQLEAPR